MKRINDPMEISEEERRRRLGRVYAILIEAAERKRAQLAQQAADASSVMACRVTVDQTVAIPTSP